MLIDKLKNLYKGYQNPGMAVPAPSEYECGFNQALDLAIGLVMASEQPGDMTDIYVSTDIESDGKIPGRNSMLSFGSAAFDKNGKMVGTFEANLELLHGATGDADTMAWWKTQPEAWAAHRENLRDPKSAMQNYVKWLKDLPGNPVFVGYPAGFDFLFIYWYLINFTDESPYSFSALDIKTYAMAMLKTAWRDTVKRNMPKHWFSNHPHNHKALDDAIGQGHLFINMLKENTENNHHCPYE